MDKVGIPVMDYLNSYTLVIQSKLGISQWPNYSLKTLLDMWVEGHGSLPPTWKNLLSLIHQLHLDDLAQQIESYLSGTKVEEHSEEVGERKEMVVAKEGEVFISYNSISFM